ncbi:MAG: SNF2-related protein [Anaerocolumna sp.]|jgi:SNF2 family DNA or RNA helicase|nr:SNF2-related protein [Anaerocolumna sp.]
MRNVELAIRGDNNAFILNPVDFDFSQLRGLNTYIKSINNGFIQNGKIEIPFDNIDVNQLYLMIIELFTEKLNCKIISNYESNSLISNAKDEADKFIEFSKKALQIRNNEILKRELETFIGVLNDDRFKRTLKPFQLLAAYHLAFSQNACNFSVPGSGKTTTVLAAYELLKNTNDVMKKIDKLLVIGPLAAFIAWKNEFKECYHREPKVLEIKGGISIEYIESRLLKSVIEEDIIIASYGSIDARKDILKQFLKNNRTMVVLDEAHRIKNVEDGIQSYAALSLSSFAKSRVILTGTPAANGYVDLYNLYKFIWPAHNIIGYTIPQLNAMSRTENDRRAADLIARISPFFIRVKKSDLNLPEPTYHQPLSISMSPIQRVIYDAIENAAIRAFENNSLAEIFRKSALIRLRQAASNPNLLNKALDDYYEYQDDEEWKSIPLVNEIDVDNNIQSLIRHYYEKEVPNKFIAVKDLAIQIFNQGGKLLVWCEFVGTCLDLSEYLTKNNIRNEILFGGTPQEERERIIIDFHNNSELSVIIANPHAVGESISLHKACHNALYLEQGYNAGVYMQSKDRIHRVGLEENDTTNYYFFHSADSVDSTTYDRVMEKERRMLKLIDSEEIPLLSENVDFMEDTEDDIKAIIRGYYERKLRNI